MESLLLSILMKYDTTNTFKHYDCSTIDIVAVSNMAKETYPSWDVLTSKELTSDGVVFHISIEKDDTGADITLQCINVQSNKKA